LTHPIRLGIRSGLTGGTTRNLCSPSWLLPTVQVARSRTSVISSQEISAIKEFSHKSQKKRKKDFLLSKFNSWFCIFFFFLLSFFPLKPLNKVHHQLGVQKPGYHYSAETGLGCFCAVVYPTKKCVRRNCEIAIFLCRMIGLILPPGEIPHPVIR
jgi:hypothetical protein